MRSELEPNVSVVIPTLNEAYFIERLLRLMLTQAQGLINEIVVVDGGSEDDTVRIASNFESVRCVVYTKPDRCRATQMNWGAGMCSGKYLWFVHADCLPPEDFAVRLRAAIADGCKLGGFSFQFDSHRILLKLNAFFTRLNLGFTRGGDQTLLIERATFEALEGYDPSFVIMEEYDLIDRARSIGVPYARMRGCVLVSARKYASNSWLTVQIANLRAYRMYKSGVAPEVIKQRYMRDLKHPKAD